MAVGDAGEADAAAFRAVDGFLDRELARLETEAGAGVDETRGAGIADDARHRVAFGAA